jgi:hypothetical protein
MNAEQCLRQEGYKDGLQNRYRATHLIRVMSSYNAAPIYDRGYLEGCTEREIHQRVANPSQETDHE